MPYTTPDFLAIRERILRDTRNLDADAHIDGDSDNFIRASTTAAAVEGLYDFQQWIARQILPDTADSEYLEQHCALRGIVRKSATKAVGTLYIFGEKDAEIPVGTRFRDAEERLYETTEDAHIEHDGEDVYTPVPCAAMLAGALEDAEDVPVTLLSAPSGVQSKGLLDIFGGTDQEDDASLLSRLLFYMQNPPGGGNAMDYKRWAEEVNGVVTAAVYPLRQGAGTVDIIITGAGGVPDEAVVNACQEYIDYMRPVTAKAYVYAPVPQYIDMTLQVKPATGYTLETLLPEVKSVLETQFALLAPGETVVLSRMVAAIMGMQGVVDVAFAIPSANVVLDGIRWARVGVVTLAPF